MDRKSAMVLALGGLMVPLGLWIVFGLRALDDANRRGAIAPVKPSASSEQLPVELVTATELLGDRSPTQALPATRVAVSGAAPEATAAAAPLTSAAFKHPGAWDSRYPRITARMVDAQGQPLQNRTLKLQLQASTDPDRTNGLGRGVTDDKGYVEFRVRSLTIVGQSGIPVIDDYDSEAYAFASHAIIIQTGIQDLGTLALLEESQRESVPLLQAWVVDLRGLPVLGIAATTDAAPPIGSTEQDENPAASVEELLATIRQEHRQLRTSPEGLLQIFGGPTDSLELSIKAKGFRPHRCTYRLPQPTLRLVLERRQWVHGSVLLDADLETQASFGVYLYSGESLDPVSDGWSDETGVSFKDPEFRLEVGSGATELQIRDLTSSALLYHSALSLVPGEDLDLGTLDLRGRVRPFQVHFQVTQAEPGDDLGMLTRWVDSDSERGDPWPCPGMELNFSRSGGAFAGGYIPREGARFEVWLRLGQYLARWQTFDVLTLPNPLLVPANVHPDECTEFWCLTNGKVVKRSELKLDSSSGPLEDD
jgi:hypothetical protein